MATIRRHHVSRALVILGGILTLVWGGAMAWMTLPWLVSGAVRVGLLLWT